MIVSRNICPSNEYCVSVYTFFGSDNIVAYSQFNFTLFVNESTGYFGGVLITIRTTYYYQNIHAPHTLYAIIVSILLMLKESGYICNDFAKFKPFHLNWQPKNVINNKRCNRFRMAVRKIHDAGTHTTQSTRIIFVRFHISDEISCIYAHAHNTYWCVLQLEWACHAVSSVCIETPADNQTNRPGPGVILCSCFVFMCRQ